MKFATIMRECKAKEPAIITRDYNSKQLGLDLLAVENSQERVTGGVISVTYHPADDRWVFRFEVKDTTK